MTKYRIRYRIRFKLKNGTVITWERFGNDMEECLATAKIAARKSYSEDEWSGGMAICGPQCGTNTYCF